MKTDRYQFESHSSPIWNEYHLWSSALSCCGWLALSFDLCLHESINLRIPLEISWLALFWVLLAFLDQPFWLLQLSISNIPWIITSMLAFQVPHLVYLQKLVSPTLGRSGLSLRTILDTYLKWICWLIQVMDLTQWVFMNPSLSPFLSTYLSPFLSNK